MKSIKTLNILVKNIRNHRLVHKNGYRVNAYEYTRETNTKEYAKLVANGICQYCHRKAPFINYTNGMPYLESHHITPRHEGGPDTVWNVIALCPNCHRMMHYGFPKNSNKLRKIRIRLHKKAFEYAIQNGYKRN